MAGNQIVYCNIVFICVWNFQGCEQGFTHISDNPFTNPHELIPLGGGIRIDYILFKVNVLDFAVEQIASAFHLHSLALSSRCTHRIGVFYSTCSADIDITANSKWVFQAQQELQNEIADRRQIYLID